ncbi:hypothetical protein [Bacillus horti]|uniref:Uncharacterized protein n=1 Tax=Caldalkalibacillus horti TaxID=77523 RepID=A0ABT9W506_9BACI|nr:hypothetical protein [Bacillus horti]MDQ0168215.1 hypothetical protein [Bacillus horti]
MDINNLVERIDEVRKNVEHENNNLDIFEWLSDCQVFLESNHSKLEFTKQFITEKEAFKTSIISYGAYSLVNFDSLAATVKSVKKLEDAKIEQGKKTAQFFKGLNS